MLDDAFQSSTDATLTDMAQRPRAPKPQAPKFSMWGLTRAVDRGARAGVAEGLGSATDLVGAAGQLIQATPAPFDPFDPYRLPTNEELDDVKQRVQKLDAEGLDFRSEGGRSFRNVARDLMPDPVTAHGAEVAVAEFARLGGKAVAAGVTLGPLAGAVLAGAEEGFTEADKLAEQGVDRATRTQAGAVTGLLTSLGFGLPVAGKTVKGTVGLALAGGPATFITQQAATREILQNAGYARLADQYDPFDPVGLTLSTLLPLGFGAAAMRSASRARGTTPDAPPADRAAADAPRGTDAPPGDRTPTARAIDELQVDAARVNLLRENVAAQRLTPANDLQGSQLHEAAVARAIDQLAEGQRVDVSDLIPPNAAAGVMDSLIVRLDANRAELLAEMGEVPPAALVKQLQTELEDLRATRPLDPEQDVQVMAKQLEADGLTPEVALAQARQDIAARVESVDARIDELETALERTQAQQALVEIIDRQTEIVRAARDTPQEPRPTTGPDGEAGQPARTDTPAAEPTTTAARATPNEAGRAEPAAESGGGQGVQVESQAVARAAQELEALNPDLMVQLDGMDGPIRLADLMTQVRQEVADDLAELPLIETAAACFLRT